MTGSAYAAPATNPEYLHQAPEGALELTPQLGYNADKVKFKVGGDANRTGLREGVRFEAGLTDMFSAGAELAAHSFKTDFSDASAKDTTESGLEDLIVFFHGRSDMTGGSFRYGLNVNFGLAKHKTEANGDENASSGGIGLQPFVGYEATVGTGTLGARLQYKFKVTDAKRESVSASGNTTSSDVSGGAVLEPSVFFEMPMQTVTLGVAYEMTFLERANDKINGVKTEYQSPHTLWDLAVYVPIDVTPSIRILPQLKYGQWSAYNTAALDSFNSWGLDVGARFVF